MPHPSAIIDSQKCQPEKCSQDGICAGAAECPQKVLKQEAPFEVPISRTSRFCKGCAKCSRACPLKAITVV